LTVRNKAITFLNKSLYFV